MVALVLRLGEADQGRLGLLKLSRADEVPRRLGSQERDDEQRDRPDPLDSHRDLVAPVGFVVDQALEDASCDELPDTPAEVDVSREVSAQRQGHHLSSVCRTCRREDTPGDVAQELADEEDLDSWRKEGDEDCGRHPDQTAHQHYAVSVLGGQVSVKHCSDDVSHSANIVEAGLPRRSDLVAVLFARVLAEFPSEGLIAPKIA